MDTIIVILIFVVPVLLFFALAMAWVGFLFFRRANHINQHGLPTQKELGKNAIKQTFYLIATLAGCFILFLSCLGLIELSKIIGILTKPH